ncbi:hypothetical protein [Azospirillum sp. TSO22-1]|uniref:hypothetical protein n=1 Tax=Azospirillum sp. TSO22-1 TaxID=716789 RepID=UPI000D64418F|nr:hypothetical protein [Azospirillum sp. TSO22-1]
MEGEAGSGAADGAALGRLLPNAVRRNPVPMNFGELYGALEARAVDGRENPYSVMAVGARGYGLAVEAMAGMLTA